MKAAVTMNRRHHLRFALRFMRREWRAGELRILVAALVVAVAAVTAVGFFKDRTRLAMERQAGELLAADLAVVASQPTAPAWAALAESGGVKTARTTTFIGAITAGTQLQLVEVKAVTPGYPLRGALRVANQAFDGEYITHELPAPGTAWVEAKVLQDLRLKVGDSISVGKRALRIDRVLTYEPDRGGDFFSIAARVMIADADLAATGLLQTGSRAEYRLLLAGSVADLARVRAQLTATLPPSARLQSVRDARPELRAALERAEQFLGLAALVSAILAGVAMATSARRYAQRHLDTIAIMRCLGATQSFIARTFSLQLAVLALVGGAVGTAIGFAVQFGLAYLLGGLLRSELPQASFMPLLLGVATGAVMLLGFALPTLARLRSVPPLRVIRRDLGPVTTRAVALHAGAAAAIAALLLWHVRDPKLALLVLIGVAATLAILAASAYGLVRALARLRARVGVAWRYGLANLARRPGSTAVQLTAFGAGLMVLLLLSIVRTDLLASWRQSLPADAPNHFLINIQPDQVAPVSEYLRTHGVAAPQLYPMVRGRWIAHNGEPVAGRDYADTHSRRLAEREFNLSWRAHAPAATDADNRIVAGKWWSSPDAHEWSVEKGLAERLGLKLGDVLRFRVGAGEVEGRVTSLREVDWDSFKVNFFIIAPPAMLQGQPATYVTSMHLTPVQKPRLTELVKNFPNVTVIQVDALMAKVRDIMDRVTLAVEYVFLFSLAAGLMVLYAALQNTHDERLREGAVLRTLGASRAQLWRGIAAEFVTLGALAGILSALAASAVAYVLASQVFHVPYRLNPQLWLIAIVTATAGITAAGLIATRAVHRQPPLKTLREV